MPNKRKKGKKMIGAYVPDTIARPTRFGFPVVRPDDFCSMHVDRASAERTFAGLVPIQQVI